MVLISLVPVLNLLYFYISTFRSMCAVPNMAVFCISLTSCFPGMLLTYFLNDFEIVTVAPIITGITFVFTFHVRCIYIVIIIMNIKYWTLWSVPSPELQLLAPTLLRSSNCSPSLWSVVVYFKGIRFCGILYKCESQFRLYSSILFSTCNP